MAWIESHTNLEKHHKLIRFQTAMRWSRNEAVGFLHRFWWSVLEVSPTGDVTALTLPEVMSETLNMKLDVVQDAILKMEEFGFLERFGERILVHSWLDYAGRFLRGKYSGNSEVLKEIWKLHRRKYGRQVADKLPTSSRQVADTHLPTKPTEPTKEKQHQAKPPDKPPAGPVPKVREPKQNGDAPPGDGSSTPNGVDYPQPKTDVQKVVMAFKLSMGVQRDDRDWDGVYFRRYSRAASDLLALFRKDVGRVADCIEAVSGVLTRKGLSWTPETVVKHASDWKEGKLFK